MSKYLLGFDVGSSSVKAALVDVDSGRTVSIAQSPEEEMPMSAPKPGWAEQDPEMWWRHAKESLKRAANQAGINTKDIVAIGIGYQMHGLVCVDKNFKPVRPSIIWCDSRAGVYGDEAFQKLGAAFCLKHYLNSPGNFTASKLKWVKEHEPNVYDQIEKVMLPGDYLALKLTGEACTTVSGLSEGIFWDFEKGDIAHEVLKGYGFDASVLSKVVPTFGRQGQVTQSAAQELGLNTGTPVAYRAGDQPNNAFSLNVLNTGETAATAGTSGVVYSVTDKNVHDPKSRVNTFVHVNDTDAAKRNGVLLCINGTGILNSWLRKTLKSDAAGLSYPAMNALAEEAPIGSENLLFYPFGNGGERILENRQVGASLQGLDFNHHTQSHVLRAAQEGIVFSLQYGFEVIRSMGIEVSVVRAGLANMFLSPLFRQAFVNTLNVPLELYETNGAVGAAVGAGVGAGVYDSFTEAFKGLEKKSEEHPQANLVSQYNQAYQLWLDGLYTGV
jgi:xylulokinase